MKVTNATLDDLITPLRQYFLKDDFVRKDINNAPPLRAELLTLDQLGNLANHLATQHKITYDRAPELLLKRLADNEEVLVKVSALLQQAVKEKTPIAPAGEWLLDNYYLIDEQIQIGKRHLPKDYSKGLPKLKNGDAAGFPRVYAIALEIISHSDGHLDINSLNRFIESYQKVSELTLGELWAIPIMLRLALIENLRRVAARIAIDRIDADLAHHWADKIIKTVEKNPKNLVLTIADMARANPPMASAFIAEYSRKLQWKGFNLTLPISWIEQQLQETGDTINGMVLAENQKQAADQVSMSNSISSLRFLTKTDWRDFVEHQSLVEQTFKTDPENIYERMDFHTRDQYRHAVEKIAKHSAYSENEVARLAIRLAAENKEKYPEQDTKSHVGYYLIDDGVKQLEALARIKLSFGESIQQVFSAHAPLFYFLGTSLLTVVLSVIVIAIGYHYNIVGYKLILLSILLVLSATQLSISLVNWIATLRVRPIPLPKLNFSKGIPTEAITLVIVPTLITSTRQIDSVVEDLEVRFLGNRNINLYFGLLTDFKDAAVQITPEDELLVLHAEEKIKELNDKYSSSTQSLFFLFHRARHWNDTEKVWMGYERKRGKLGELNALLRGHGRERFMTIIGDEEIFPSIKYVITLDTDTQLPREAAYKLVGLMAHPLNKPLYDAAKQRIVRGYGIIQPRIAISLQGATRSLYTRMHENDSGIDPYTRVTSDVYQDVFKEGSFIGKGIYDVDAFEQALNNRFPENRILSHDLLEGSYARCGYASDIQFYEEYPSRYSDDISRRHRWIRGDWQIANWFLPWAPDANQKLHRNPISTLSRWKIFDNLRRSIVPIVLLATLILSWIVLPAPLLWIGCVLGVILVPPLIVSAWHLLWKPKEISFRQHAKHVFENTVKNIFQSLFMLACLPYEAMISADAIARTLWRVYVSKKNLLEWNPSGFVPKTKKTVISAYVTMISSPLLSMVILVIMIYYSPATIGLALPFLLTWILSPAVVYWISKPLPSSKSKLSASQTLYLRELSRKTWAFFETQVNEENNWLPPDNIQQYPITIVAHRTSPTNIGMALLANLAAVDFGYSTTSQLADRTAKTFVTLNKMERHAGHFMNWYDTRTLETLNPRYISAVDSGNLAGHLLTLRQGLLELVNKKIIAHTVWQGIGDTIRVIVKKTASKNHAGIAELQQTYQTTIIDSTSSLKDLYNSIKNLLTIVTKVANNTIQPENKEIHEWIIALEDQLKEWQTEIAMRSPWMLHDSIPEKYNDLALQNETSTLLQLAQLKLYSHEVSFAAVNDHQQEDDRSEFEKSLYQCVSFANEQITQLYALAAQCQEFATMEYDFLYDKAQRLLSIGYNVDEHRCDASFYDLLASEARLGIFVAIAQGKIPQESWFALGRRLTSADSTPVLLSWSGSMFEYLMPNLVMPVYENTLLDETCKGSVKKQIEYGNQQGVPWGISESCYNMVDASLSYQYRAFGVPELGFKRGLGLDLVIAPYATVMALMVDPAEACKNLERLTDKGYEGNYGFFESIDFSPSRLPRAKVPALIQTFMVHHQGMSLLSLSYLLCDRPNQRRFEADATLQTALLLLQERVPKATGYYSLAIDTEEIIQATTSADVRVINTPHTVYPEIQLLSNGNYHVMVSNAGGGYSRWKNIALTRWREDTTCDNWGAFCYVRDIQSGEFWSTSYQPTLKEATRYEAIFSQGRVEFKRTDNGIELHTEIIVSPEDNVEIRRIHITNNSRIARKLELTSYGEIVNALAVADDAHPAFSNLFIQTEIVANQQAILCSRRPRSDDEAPPWIFHLMKGSTIEADVISYETDRDKFIGRGNTIVNPKAMRQKETLTGSQGSVLDPIVSIQYRLTIDASETTIIDIVTGIAETRTACQTLIDKYQDRNFRNRGFELSWTHSQVVLRQINASEADAQLFGRLASSVIYTNPVLRASKDILVKNNRGQSSLWSYSISGDLPIVVLQVSDTTNITIIRQMLQARAYWQFKGLAVDLIIINEDHSGYRQVLQEQIQSIIAAGMGSNVAERQGGIYVRLAEQISTEDRILMNTVARVIISDKYGSLHDHLNRKHVAPISTSLLLAEKTFRDSPLVPKEHFVPHEDFQLFNGLGGYSDDGREYVIETSKTRTTPLPWINVIANKNFGTIVTESGPSYTWSENAHEFRLTPWINDPVNTLSGEAFYIRDEESGQYWSPMPLPATGTSTYVTRHGFGYTTFTYKEDDIITETTVHVDLEANIKFTKIKIHNQSGRTRSLSVTGYAEWVLGGLRPKTVMHVVTELDPGLHTLLTRNQYNTEFPNRVTFFDVDTNKFNFTTDRQEFIGRNGTLKKPEAMKRARLSGKQGAGLDPCTAIQVPIALSHGQDYEVTFKMGAAKDFQEVHQLITAFRVPNAIKNSINNVHTFWKETLGVVQLKTPDQSLNLLANGWLLYQVISCRLWGRSGFYQSGGAFGFRDQLQDVLALLHTNPTLTREQIILSASRQFKEGDAQHWWHPPLGRGVRTRCSDDFLWLAFTTSRYIESTQDEAILHEVVPFIEGRLLNDDEESYYDLPAVSIEEASLYEHCKRAIQHALHFGDHGLPFIGSGDWNDGMNMVGIKGKGESVWLGFFLYDILKRFESLAIKINDTAFAKRCIQQADLLQKNINGKSWDGEWYRRAYFDDGSPLGSSVNDECRIDSISQSWSVLSGAGEKEKSYQAMESVDKHLVDREYSLLRLLHPPFNHSEKDPGYIKGYVPGVRENGGQYSHAAIWMVMAVARLGNTARTWELLSMINPLNHGKSKEDIAHYKTEPYVMAADVYGVSPHEGRGGWTWYTGSASWMYQLITDSFLGLQKEGNTLKINPCVPVDWDEYTIDYRYKSSVYHIQVRFVHTTNESIWKMDDQPLTQNVIMLEDDNSEHNVIANIYRVNKDG